MTTIATKGYSAKLQNPSAMMYGPTKHEHTHRTKDSFTDEQWEQRCTRFRIRNRFDKNNPKQRNARD